MQLVDDQVLDPAGDRQARRKLARPELGLGDSVAAGTGECLGDGLQAPHEAATHGPVEGGRIAGVVPAAGILAAATDLIAREEVGAVYGLALGVFEAVHVRSAAENGEVGEDFALPNPAGAGSERENWA